MHDSSSEIRYARALRRLETFSERASRLARCIAETEFGWAPDDGIATIRDHVCELVVSVRGLNSRLAPGRNADEFSPELVGSSDLLSALRGGHDRCRRRLEQLQELGEPLPESFFDELERHGDLLAERCGSIALLRQLIDPERPKTLLGT